MLAFHKADTFNEKRGLLRESRRVILLLALFTIEDSINTFVLRHVSPARRVFFEIVALLLLLVLFQGVKIVVLRAVLVEVRLLVVHTVYSLIQI